MSDIDDLENKALDARMDLVSHRSHFSKVCENLQMHCIKNDFKISKALQIKLESDPFKSRFDDASSIAILNLRMKVPDPWKGFLPAMSA